MNEIERGDITRMKDLARRVSFLRDPVKIHQMETDFKRNMAAKYGEKTAIKMLVKVWKLADQLRKMETRT